MPDDHSSSCYGFFSFYSEKILPSLRKFSFIMVGSSGSTNLLARSYSAELQFHRHYHGHINHAGKKVLAF